MIRTLIARQQRRRFKRILRLSLRLFLDLNLCRLFVRLAQGPICFKPREQHAHVD